MVQESNKAKSAIIGAGASGCMCAYFLLKAGVEVTLFDKNPPLKTLLPTGGGRCNLAHAIYDSKDLASNYPRGEKFLYSVFSKFGTYEAIETFKELGIKTYTQADGRIFPVSNSSSDVRNKILARLKELGGSFIQEKVTSIDKLIRIYDCVVIATGGHAGYELLTPYNIDITTARPSLVGLKVKTSFAELSGITVKNAEINGLEGDILFTEFGLSGPLIYTISSIKAFDKFPYELEIDFAPSLINLQEKLDLSPRKELKNIIADYMPKRLAEFIICDLPSVKGYQINRKLRYLIENRIHHYNIIIIGTNKGSETVTAGGVNLDEIYPNTMEFKKVPNLYCIGEVLNIDGLCGGFNLQNAWSTAYVCAAGIKEKFKY